MSTDTLQPQPAFTRWPVSFLRDNRPEYNFISKSPGMQELGATADVAGRAWMRSFSQQVNKRIFKAASWVSISRMVLTFAGSGGSTNSNPGRDERRRRILG